MTNKRNEDMFELADDVQQNAVIKVVGVGGGGGNAVKHMLAGNVDGVEFICANTDAQALRDITSRSVIQLGNELTKGLGAGANPEVGRQAALEDRERIAAAIKGADMVFIAAGMGGGTGTGAAPIVAEVAKELGILTVAVVTKPFGFEGKKRALVAEQGLKQLAEHVDSLITIPNEKLMAVLGKNAKLTDAFDEANNVLKGAVQGIADLITQPGLINVDFADVRTVMSEMGQAMMGTGVASGENRAAKAAEAAIRSPLLDDIDLRGARGILVNVTAGLDFTIGEYDEVGRLVSEFASEDATVVVGTVINPEMSGELRVTVVATGLGGRQSAVSIAPALPQAKAQEPSSAAVVERPSKAVDNTPRTVDGRIDYGKLDRAPGARHVGNAVHKTEVEAYAEGYIDIPTFLRRQAD